MTFHAPVPALLVGILGACSLWGGIVLLIGWRGAVGVALVLVGLGLLGAGMGKLARSRS